MKLEIPDANIRALVAAIVKATLEEIAEQNGERVQLPKDRIGFPEAEAAQLLGLPKHVLRDARLRGDIVARRLGKQFVYERGELVAFLKKKE